SDVFRQLDYNLHDTHSRFVAPKVDFDNVVVIDIDEDSITQLQPKLGAWPYDREVYALVTQWLKQVGVRAIAFDILFAEPRKGDAAFAATLDERVILAAAALPFTFERDAAYHKQLQKESWGAAPQAGVYPLTDLTLPRAQLTARAHVGVVSADTDSDGVLRRIPLVYSAYGRLAPGLGLALWHAGTPPIVNVTAGRLDVNGNSWPVSAQGEVLLRYPKNLSGLRTVPFYQIALAASGVAGLESLGASLHGKRVVIGSSSAALGDYKQTPMGRQPGIKVQAMIAALLAGGHVLKPRAWTWELLSMGGALLLAVSLGHPRWQPNMAVQWLVFPLIIIFVGGFAATAIGSGQAIGLLFAICAGVLTHLIGLLYQQVQLFRRNQRLEMEKRAATQADALKSQFLSHITHELRTPLTAIMGFNNINWHGSDLGRDQRMKNSEIVDRNCQHMLSLVNNLLDQAKINAGQLTIQRHPDKLHPVIMDAVATMEPLLVGKPVKLRADETGVPAFLDIDVFRLRQIILNLLSNAIKFTEKGEINVLATWQDGALTISVIDTGPGMPEEAVKRLFTAFQQADAGVAARHGGTGLGLTISRNLARLMDGDITVRSTVGQGTVFTVTIAAASVAPYGAERRATRRTAESVHHVLQGTVLVAEDMPDTRALVVRHLEQLGLTVLQAENGEQAIEIALAKRPDVVLMDMDMPVVAGAEATRTLRMCGFSAPVLALTAHKSEEQRLRALAAGCNGLIDKPLTRSSLLVPLSTALAPTAEGRASGR
ncbi:MAG TPA: CHASE2 domain-containing protein, partial [Burkholderiales bacterium]|nr:CHASE2 domain-containing protein [Burkholderiales bacterium]